MIGKQIGLGKAILGANVRSPALPYKVTFVATYHCNFRCQMCNIWQKKSKDEMTPAEVETFFSRWPQFRWVHLTGGELFMRRDLDDLVAAIQGSCRNLFLLNFPTTGWFGDKTVDLVEKTLARGVGRLMTTISIDGPRAIHEELRGLPGSWDRGIETFRRLRGIKRSNFQTVVGMTLMEKNARLVDETVAAIRQVIPDFQQSELHLNIGHESGHYFANLGKAVVTGHRADILRAVDDHRRRTGSPLHPVKFLEDRYQALIAKYYETGKSPLPCTALSSSCFVDAYWNLYPCSIWDERVGNLREAGFDLQGLWDSQRRRDLRDEVAGGRCDHCWTPCEAYPTILGNLARATTARASTPKPAVATTA
ncbi:MAG TPA: radical SAM protein [Vicinamibacterales bacterium]|nr:radical SAM protein [Vicinamibacterales bacterium]